MRCFQCQEENDQGSRFCKNCGKSFFRAGVQNQKPYRDEYPHKEGKQAFASLASKKRGRSIAVVLSGLGFCVILGIRAYFYDNVPLESLAIFTAALTLIVSSYVKRISEGEYAALPGARDAHGNHRCVYCGNRGVWKHTPYKTNSTIAACSKCKKELYCE